MVHYVVVRLYQLRRFPFAVEECVMRIVRFPASRNTSECIGKLQTVERPKAAALSPRGGSDEESPTKRSFFLPHILGHDKKLAEFIAAKMPAFGR